jgi:hypothetical protein
MYGAKAAQRIKITSIKAPNIAALFLVSLYIASDHKEELLLIMHP